MATLSRLAALNLRNAARNYNRSAPSLLRFSTAAEVQEDQVNKSIYKLKIFSPGIFTVQHFVTC